MQVNNKGNKNNPNSLQIPNKGNSQTNNNDTKQELSGQNEENFNTTNNN
jgi:hypothetical protein